jgi:uncharacterized membrane protein
VTDRPGAAIGADQLGDALCAAAGGFGGALFAWQVSHPLLVAPLLLQNELSTPERRTLIFVLLAGSALGTLLWLSLLYLLSRAPSPNLAPLNRRLSGLVLLLTLLPFYRWLAIPQLEIDLPWLTLGLAVLAALVAALAVSRLGKNEWLETATATRGWWATLILALGYLIYMGWLTVARHNGFQTHSFDLGIHDQALFTILRDGYMRSTQYGPQPIDYIGDHFSPIFYVLAPLYALWPDARMLLILQTLFLAAAALPIYLLTRLESGRTLPAFALAASFLLHPALHGVNTRDFHQIALLVPLLLTALYFLQVRRNRLFLLFLALSLAVKEEVALTGAAIGVYAFVALRRRRLGAAVVGSCLLYFALVVGFIMPALGGTPQINRFAGLMPEGAGGMGGVIQTILSNPVYALTFVLSNPDKMVYLGQLLAPLMAIPLLGGAAWLAAVPALAIPLLSSAETQYSIGYHYSSTLLAVMYFAAALAWRRPWLRRHAGPAVSAILTASLAMNFAYGYLPSKRPLPLPPTAHQQMASRFFRQIPASASVSTLSDILPHLSARENIYLFPISEHSDYILFDADLHTNYWPYEEKNARLEAAANLAERLRSGEYGVVDMADGWILLRKNADTGRNVDALVMLYSLRMPAAELRGDLGQTNQPDAEATSGQSRVVRAADLRNADLRSAVYGPYASLLAGRYRVTFRMKTEANVGGTRLAGVDVFSNEAGGSLVAEEIEPSQFAQPGAYQDFTLQLDLRKPIQDAEFRVIYYGPETLSIDQINLVPTQLAMPVGTYAVNGLPGDLTPSEQVDASAILGKARIIPADPTVAYKAAAYGPFIQLLPGQYVAKYALKTPTPGILGRVATIDVFSKQGAGQVGTADIDGRDFIKANAYQNFSVPFSLTKTTPALEFRIFSFGLTELWADRIEIDYVLTAS